MKTMLRQRVGVILAALILLARTGPALAEDVAAANLKTVSGSVAAVDAKDKVLKLSGLIFSKTFVLGDNCTLALADRKAASLADFHPGEQVTVTYKSVQGVLVASEVAEQRLVFTGSVSALDATNRSLSVRSGQTTRAFKLADNCNVVLAGDKKGVVDDIKLGGHVTVVYNTPKGNWTATRIEHRSLELTGTLGAIDTRARTLTVGKKLIGDKNFHLAGDCAIVENGKINGRLQDLKIGNNYTVSYTTVDGVNIVNRIAPAPPTDPASATTGDPLRGALR